MVTGVGRTDANFILQFSVENKQPPPPPPQDKIEAFVSDIEHFYSDHVRGYFDGIDLAVVLR